MGRDRPARLLSLTDFLPSTYGFLYGQVIRSIHGQDAF